MLETTRVFSSLLPLSSTVPSNTNPHVLNVVRHDESKNNFHNNHHHHSISRPSWKNFNWYILMSGTSLVYSILLSLPSTVSSTAKSHVLNVVRDIGHVKSTKKTFKIATLTTAYHNLVKKFPLMWYILMLGISLVFSSLLSFPSTVQSTMKPHEQKLGKWGIHEKDFQRTS